MGTVLNFTTARNERLAQKVREKFTAQAEERTTMMQCLYCALEEDIGASALDYVLVEEALQDGDKLFYFMKRTDLGI